MNSGSARQMKLGALLSYFGIFLNIAIGLLYTPWMIREIGQSDFGLYSLITSFLAYFIMDFGLGNTVAKFIAEYKVRGERQNIHRLLGITARIYLVITAVLALLLVTIFFFLSDIFVKLTVEEIHKLKIIYCIAGFFSLLMFPFSAANGILIAYERFIFFKGCDIATKVLSASMMVIALLLGYKLYALVLVNALVGAGIVAAKVWFIRREIGLEIHIRYRDWNLLKKLFAFSFWVMVGAVAQRLLMNVVPSVLGIFSGTVQIAVFAVAMTIEGYTWLFANALNGLFFFQVSKFVHQKDMNAIQSLMIKVGRIQFFVVGMIVAGFIVLGRDFISLWVGNKFATSYYVILLLIIPGLISLPMEVANTLLFVDNKLKYRGVLFLAGSIFSVVISIFLTPEYGAIGAGIGIFSALLLFHCIGMIAVYQKVLKLHMGDFLRKCHLRMSGAFVLSLLLGCGIDGWVSAGGSWGVFLVKGAAFGVLYTALMWFGALHREERGILLQPLRKILTSF